MNLSLREDQQLLQRAARDLLSAHAPVSLARQVEDERRGMARALWKVLADHGWLGVGLPAAVGGSGGPVEVAVLAEELGRVIAPVPWLSTAVWSANVLAGCLEPAAARVLSQLIAGNAVVVPALRERDTGYRPTATHCQAAPADGEWRLSGEKQFVPDGSIADAFLVLARTGEGEEGLFLLPAAEGVRLAVQPTTDGHSLAVLWLDQAPAILLGAPGAGWALVEPAEWRAAAAAAAWMLGAAERALEMAVEYARVRVQFGRPIGSFQAVSHKLAEVRWRLDALRMLTYRAAAALARDPTSTAAVAAAKLYANRWTIWALHRCHEVFAGIGFMRIHDLQLYYRRLLAVGSLFGDEAHHQREVVRSQLFSPNLPAMGQALGPRR
ncbi:MAG: acyl-CoA/acyl-ACP dehydrogenase [Chloroflexi bacterium]|nr:acyl-CoA/acyl-ACP dehydrogenase [Chloroflexota bacterium]